MERLLLLNSESCTWLPSTEMLVPFTWPPESE